MIKGLVQSARRGARMKMLSGPTYGGWGGFPIGDAAEGLDYNKEAGNRWDNSIVWACLAFGVRILNSCPIQTGTIDESGSFHPVIGHELSDLLTCPNEWYDGTLLQTAQIWGEMSRGNSFVYLHRKGQAGIITGLEVLPEGSCIPYTEPGSGDFITEYRIQTPTGYFPAPPKDILHMRWMIPNPFNLTIGMSPLEACLPEVVSDKKTGRIRSALLNNSGVSTTVISPKSNGEDGSAEFTPAQERQIKNRVRDTVAGDNVGMPLVFPMPLDMQKMAFDPSQLGLESVTKHDEERICAVYGIAPLAVCLGAGLSQQNNRAGAESAIDATFDNFVMPYIEHRERQLTNRLVPELGQPGQVVRYDRSRIPALKARLVREVMLKTGGPVETPNEGRGQLGLGPIEGGDVLRSSKGQQTYGADTKGKRPDDYQDDED